MLHAPRPHHVHSTDLQQPSLHSENLPPEALRRNAASQGYITRCYTLSRCAGALAGELAALLSDRDFEILSRRAEIAQEKLDNLTEVFREALDAPPL